MSHEFVAFCLEILPEFAFIYDFVLLKRLMCMHNYCKKNKKYLEKYKQKGNMLQIDKV